MPVSGLVCATADSPGLCSCSVLRMPCHQAGQLVMPRRCVACLVCPGRQVPGSQEGMRRAETAFLDDRV